ncbi:MAG: hypothetical protein ACREX9_14075 [Gammaproteobacteria bacterium]
MSATRKILGAVVLVQLCLTAAVLADQERRNLDEEVMHRDRRFLARYSDGTTERYLVSYRGFVKQYMKESGHSVNPRYDWFVDTRRCHWAIDGRIIREVLLVHRSDRQIPYEIRHEKLSKRWNVPYTSKDSDSVFTRILPGGCNDAWERFERDANKARYRVKGELRRISNQDLVQLPDIMKQELNAAAIADGGL